MKEVKVKFYTPDDKRKYYGKQLKTGKDKDGKDLTKRQKAYRAGYLSAFGDGVGAYKAKQKKQKN